MKHLEKVIINNFLCFNKEHIFQFTEGMNAIVGPNDSGKSSLLAAVSWVVFGKPSGDSVVNWDGDRDTSVRLYFADGLCVERCRIKDKNFYFWCFKNEPRHELNAIGNSVPEEIERLLQLQDINFQGQANNLFPMQMTPSELGIAINRYCQLGDMHETIKRLATEIKKDETAYENNAKRETVLQEQIDQTAWAVTAEGFLTHASAFSSKIANDTQKCRQGRSLLSNIQETKKQRRFLKTKKDLLEKEMGEARELKKTIQSKQAALQNAKRIIKNLSVISSSQIELKRKMRVREEIEIARAEYQYYNELTKKWQRAKGKLQDIQSLKQENFQLSKKIQVLRSLPEKYRKELPLVCPLCGEERKNK